jgi:hypothetical protein
LKKGPLSINAIFGQKIVKNGIYTEGSLFIWVFLQKAAALRNICRIGLLTVYEGAAHRNIKISYGALHLQITILTFFATNIAVRCTFEFL